MNREDYINDPEVYGETVRTNLELKKFNWGAFGFTVIWGLFNGWVALKSTFPIIYILCFSMYISAFFGKYGLSFSLFCILCFMIYCGINGNQWAYSHRGFRGLQDFVETQQNWGIAYAVAAIISGAFFINRIIHF